MFPGYLSSTNILNRPKPTDMLRTENYFEKVKTMSSQTKDFRTDVY